MNTRSTKTPLSFEKQTIRDPNPARLTFSSSFKLAGDTSECLLSSGLLGGANPEPRPPIWLPLWQPSLASLCLLWRASRTGTSSNESVDSCVTIGWSRDASFRRHTLHLQDDCKKWFSIQSSLRLNDSNLFHDTWVENESIKREREVWIKRGDTKIERKKVVCIWKRRYFYRFEDG